MPGLQLPQDGLELAADYLAGLGGMAAPDTAGHHHLFALRGHAQALQPLVVIVLEDIAADEHLPEAAGALLEEQLEGLSEQVLPAGVKAELQFGDLAVSGPQPAHPRHGLLAVVSSSIKLGCSL